MTNQSVKSLSRRLHCRIDCGLAVIDGNGTTNGAASYTIEIMIAVEGFGLIPRRTTRESAEVIDNDYEPCIR